MISGFYPLCKDPFQYLQEAWSYLFSILLFNIVLLDFHLLFVIVLSTCLCLSNYNTASSVLEFMHYVFDSFVTCILCTSLLFSCIQVFSTTPLCYSGWMTDLTWLYWCPCFTLEAPDSSGVTLLTLHLSQRSRSSRQGLHTAMAEIQGSKR